MRKDFIKLMGAVFMNKKYKIVKRIFLFIVIFIFLAILFIGAFAAYAYSNVDFYADEALFSASKSEKVTRLYYDINGSSKVEEYEPILFEEVVYSGEKRLWYSYDEISSYLKDAFVAMEDREFFTHHGVNFKRTLLAMINYLFKREKSFGGSTITQQVIKNISGNNEKTVQRKLEEIIRAYHVEGAHSKEEIFELYLNIIPMSNNIVGIGLASKSLFGKEPSELSAVESATIVAIANAPTKYNPYRNPSKCIEKRNKVLYAMRQQRVISESEYKSAKEAPLNLAPEEKGAVMVHSWFADVVLSDITADLMKRYGYSKEAAKMLLSGGGVSIYTTVDPKVQNIMNRYFENSDNFPSDANTGLQYSMVITDSEKNLLRGVAGAVGKKNGNRVYNYATTLNVPGSVLKPLALYLPLIDSKKITWSTVFDDVPVTFIKNSDGSYNEYPKNYPNVYDGLTTVADALRVSKNTVAARLYNMQGPEKIYKYLTENFGIDTLVYKRKEKHGTVTDLAIAPLALGQLSDGVSLRKLTEAYTVFPSEGKMTEGRSYIAVFDADGNILIENKKEEKIIADKMAARVMNQLLMRVVESGTASKIRLKELYDTAGKTGTSSNDKDRLFIGYTPYYTGGIWCGYPDNSKSVGNHNRNHLDVWDAVMTAIHEETVTDNFKSFSTKGLISAAFCLDSGELFSEDCLYDARGSRVSYGYFIKGTEPSEECHRHTVVYKELFPYTKRISLVEAEKRDFPKEISIGDSAYVYHSDKKSKRHIS